MPAARSRHLARPVFPGGDAATTARANAAQELGFGSGMTCWSRLRDWNEAGVQQKLHELLLSELRAADLLDFSRAAVDSSHIRAMKGGPAAGPSPWRQSLALIREMRSGRQRSTMGALPSLATGHSEWVRMT